MKKIAVTMGDPSGVGPEVIVLALSSPLVHDICIPVVIGDLAVTEDAIRLSNSALKLRSIKSAAEAVPDPSVINLIEIGAFEGTIKGAATAQGGRAAASYIKQAVDLALKGEVDAIVTAPISKEALKLAGLKWPGHTEMLAELTGTRDYAMMLTGGPLRVVLATIHTAIRDVPGMITKERVLKTIRLGQRACCMLNIQSPRIGVAGLNPHAGEAGMFGDEEITAIFPAIEEANREGIPCTGPYPPDTVFHKAYKGELDLIICMYHDQGLIPLKMIAFDKGVNTTIGLPFIRTSPDHGTAYDIAWQGKADPASMAEALRLASEMRS
ncbi:MAG: 4-hydroxythreonine-4-phosphate dehydrogenase PdxA [Nitrospirae bacterium]|nr:4-hydroxythreonine-4-phosphate dehydrogenase PdxA [Nitrospirota bacterium]